MKNNVEKYIFRSLFIIVILFLLCNLWFGFRIFTEGYPTYESMIISDWLINYEGGFVRRGLAGEILYLFYSFYPHPIYTTIITLYFGGLIILGILVFRIFRKEGWSLFLYVFPVCFYFSFLGARRDYWILILTYIIMYQFSIYIKYNRTKNLISTLVLSILSILFHEASFFFTIPVLYFFTVFRNKHKPFLKRFLKSTIIWSPALLVMALVCQNKGNTDIATSIWHSWMPCFTSFPLSEGLPSLGSAIQWLTYDASYAIHFHINKLWLSYFIYNIPSWPFTLISLISIYYLVTKINTIDLGIWKIKELNSIRFSTILVIQLLFLTPMLGLLSCDYGRIIMYWVLSSIFTYYWLQEEADNIPILNKLSYKIQKIIFHNNCLSNKWLYFCILVTTPIPEWQGANIISCFAFVPLGWRMSFWQLFLESLPIQ